MSDLSQSSALKQTSAGRSKFIGSRPSSLGLKDDDLMDA